MSKFKLPKEIKRVWLTKLRDGSYKKCIGSIGRGNKRCALGILVAEGFTKPIFGCYLPSEFMPRDVQKQIGTLSDDGKSFKKIADWVEENL
jgi:hypothetical protein